jgi:hypothetical protein
LLPPSLSLEEGGTSTSYDKVLATQRYFARLAGGRKTNSNDAVQTPSPTRRAEILTTLVDRPPGLPVAVEKRGDASLSKEQFQFPTTRLGVSPGKVARKSPLSWYYLDYRGRERGPHSTEAMRRWLFAEYQLHITVPVRLSTTEAFVPLNELYSDIRFAFQRIGTR